MSGGEGREADGGAGERLEQLAVVRDKRRTERTGERDESRFGETMGAFVGDALLALALARGEEIPDAAAEVRAGEGEERGDYDCDGDNDSSCQRDALL